MHNTGSGPEPLPTSLNAVGRFDPVFSERRVSYELGALDEAGLAATPLEMFRRWYDRATASGALAEPNAMTVATVDAAGMPSVRTVLLKQADSRGFVFFTNHGSRKGTDLAARPAVGLLFGWLPLQRQVAIRGLAERVPEQESAAYFGSRPWGSRIGAWASRQSAPASSRSEIEQRWADHAERWPDHGRADDVPLPPFWGGWLVRPVEVEFWQGRPSRLHDRLVYLPIDATVGRPPALDDPTSWRVQRRQP